MAAKRSKEIQRVTEKIKVLEKKNQAEFMPSITMKIQEG